MRRMRREGSGAGAAARARSPGDCGRGGRRRSAAAERRRGDAADRRLLSRHARRPLRVRADRRGACARRHLCEGRRTPLCAGDRGHSPWRAGDHGGGPVPNAERSRCRVADGRRAACRRTQRRAGRSRARLRRHRQGRRAHLAQRRPQSRRPADPDQTARHRGDLRRRHARRSQCGVDRPGDCFHADFLRDRGAGAARLPGECLHGRDRVRARRPSR